MSWRLKNNEVAIIAFALGLLDENDPSSFAKVDIGMLSEALGFEVEETEIANLHRRFKSAVQPAKKPDLH